MVTPSSNQHPEVLPQNVDEDGRRVGSVQWHGRWVVDRDDISLDPHEFEQLTHDLFGDTLLGFVDSVEISGALRGRALPFPRRGSPARRTVPGDPAQTRRPSFSGLRGRLHRPARGWPTRA